MTELEDLARAREFIRSLEFGPRIECYLRKHRDRRSIVTPFEILVIGELTGEDKTHTEIARELDSIPGRIVIALTRLASKGIAETIDGKFWRLTGAGRASITPMEKP